MSLSSQAPFAEHKLRSESTFVVHFRAMANLHEPDFDKRLTYLDELRMTG